MFHLIPAPLHRLALRLGYRLIWNWLRIRKPARRGASVIVERADGKILFVRHSYGSRAWCFPGGGHKRGEEPEHCARREMREELGRGIAKIELVGLIEETINGSPHASSVFAASLDGEPEPDGREIIETRFFDPAAPPDELPYPAQQRLALWRAYRSGN
ncbi:NUDIX hydrolase [Novosphingobium aquimarinum]|uniref:NUDIX hydrolase n=1 Tax=Novosphingobium aquimarinum TaxID=2682494 RepID=UPI0012EB0ECD|nr:NUDIX domain-containing protein [Novosphingobium aquimarinum]